MATATEPIAFNEGLSENMKLQVTKVIRAKRERVFNAWTDPRTIATWFGTPGRVTSGVRVDLRIGGEYYFEMTSDTVEPRIAFASGTYTEIVSNERVQFTWQGTWTEGEVTLVTVLLKDVTGGTEVTLTHERFTSVDQMKAHEQGWLGAFERINAVVTA